MKKNVLKTVTSILLISSLLACAGCGKKDVTSTEETKKNQTEETVINDNTEETVDYAKDFLDKFSNIEKQAKELSDSIENDDLSQTEYNMKSGDLYTLWDDCLNELWGVLDKTLSKEDMAKLSEEENTWIADKEKQIADAGAEVEGGSMQPMLENLKGAELTEKRVYELIKLLPGAENVGSSDEQTNDNFANSDSSSLFESFLAGDAEVKISDKLKNDNIMFDVALNAGNSFTIKTLDSLNTLWEPINGVEPKIAYASFENPNGKLYAVSFMYELEATAFTEFYIISENNGELIVNYVIDGWERRYPMFNKFGVCYDDGSNGAGSHGTNVIVPTKDFEYVTLSTSEINSPGWNFYDDNGSKETQPITDIMNEVGNLGYDDSYYLTFTRQIINGKTFFYYLADDITQEMVDEIDGIAKKYDFTFDGKATADAALLDYAKELSVDDIYTNEDYAQWKDK